MNISFSATGPPGLLTVQSSGGIEIDDGKRILTKSNVKTSGGGEIGGLLNMLSGGSSASSSATGFCGCSSTHATDHVRRFDIARNEGTIRNPFRGLYGQNEG